MSNEVGFWLQKRANNLYNGEAPNGSLTSKMMSTFQRSVSQEPASRYWSLVKGGITTRLFRITQQFAWDINDCEWLYLPPTEPPPNRLVCGSALLPAKRASARRQSARRPESAKRPFPAFLPGSFAQNPTTLFALHMRSEWTLRLSIAANWCFPAVRRLADGRENAVKRFVFPCKPPIFVSDKTRHASACKRTRSG